MSFSFVALCILLISLIGFFIAHSRAVSFEKAGIRMHSRPFYYGFWVFITSLVPAWLLLSCWHFAAQLYLEHRALSDIYAYQKSLISAELEQSPPPMSASEENSEVQKPPAVNSAVSLAPNIAASPAPETQLDLVSLQKIKAQTSLGLSIVKSLLRAPDLLTSPLLSYRELQQSFAERHIMVPLSGEDYMVSIAYDWRVNHGKLKILGALLAFSLAILGLIFGLFSIKPRSRARNKVEKVILIALYFCSIIAVLTTIGIVCSLIFETLSFFHKVPFVNYFFGTVWDPRFAAIGSSDNVGQFGLIPLLAGTLYIAFVAMLLAVPVGLFSAIYMAEYASKSLRATVKPLLEVLAGIPTIVYGFFALITVGPLLRDLSAALAGGHGFIMAQSVLTAGLVMGILLIPFISSLSDDIINAVPQSLRDGSYGLGATRCETIKKVVLPAALPGIVGALLLAASRAIGETMIVVLAAGVAARLSFNPFDSMTTITVKIVNQLTGDLAFDSPQTLVAFALGMTLFIFTLIMNAYAVYIVRKYRQQYE